MPSDNGRLLRTSGAKFLNDLMVLFRTTCCMGQRAEGQRPMPLHPPDLCAPTRDGLGDMMFWRAYLTPESSNTNLLHQFGGQVPKT